MNDTIKVLLIDDEASFIEPISRWLAAKGYAVSMVPNGAEGLSAIKKDTPDIVFLDINMPGMDGLEVLKKIRAFNKELPVIMLTAAFDSEENIATAKQWGAAGFFAKSYSLEHLLAIIQMALKTHKNLQAPEKDRPGS